MDPAGIARRTVVRVEDSIPFGGDAQVDDRNVIITPVNPAATDPFLLLSEDWFSTPGFEWHPHRGLETVTLVVDGVLEHGDNMGNAGALTTGDVQWMTAGRGIIHRELAFRNERAHTLQLWVNLPGDLKMVDTRYQNLLSADHRARRGSHRTDRRWGRRCNRPGADLLAGFGVRDHLGAEPQTGTPAARSRPRVLLPALRRGNGRGPAPDGWADRLVGPSATTGVGDHSGHWRGRPAGSGHDLQWSSDRPAGRDGWAVRHEQPGRDRRGVPRLSLRKVRRRSPPGPAALPLIAP